MTESRTKKTLLNARVEVVYICLAVSIAFFSRKIFITCLGEEFVGLTSTITGLIGFLNLAELGIGTAIGINLFKPLAQNDRENISDIISVMGYMYRRIGLLILVVGLILSFFFPWFFHKADLRYSIIYCAFYASLLSSLFTYFFTYKTTLLSADQRNYEVTKYTKITNIIKLAAQMGVAYLTSNALYWILIELLFSVISCVIINWRVRFIYPWLKSSHGAGKDKLREFSQIKTHIRQLFVQKISIYATGQITPLIIYGYLSLTSVLYYTNYTTVIGKLSLFVNALMGSSEASVGNLIASENVEAQLKVYKELTSIRFFIAGFFVFMLYYLINPFISLWLGEKYLFNQLTVILFLFDIFISYYRGSTDQFLYGYGLFKDVYAPVTEGMLYIGGCMVLVPKFGIDGLLIGLIISKYLIVGLWKPYFLFREGFRLPFMGYIKLWLTEAGLLALSFIFSMMIIRNLTLEMDTFLNWTISALKIGAVYMGINVVLMTSFAPGFRFTVKRLRLALMK